MKALPHRYVVTAQGGAQGPVNLSSSQLAPLLSAAPAEFDGPGNLWSPETLLTAAVGDCFILTFRAIARASGLVWEDLTCVVEGVLDRVEGTLRFTEFTLRVRLNAPGQDREKAQRLLEKAEKTCLITNSLRSNIHLHAEVLT